jgi:hypothetical protein
VRTKRSPAKNRPNSRLPANFSSLSPSCAFAILALALARRVTFLGTLTAIDAVLAAPKIPMAGLRPVELNEIAE